MPTCAIHFVKLPNMCCHVVNAGQISLSAQGDLFRTKWDVATTMPMEVAGVPEKVAFHLLNLRKGSRIGGGCAEKTLPGPQKNWRRGFLRAPFVRILQLRAGDRTGGKWRLLKQSQTG